MLLSAVLLLLCVLTGVINGACDFRTDSKSCYNNFLSFEAIEAIHNYLDDDKNGEVDSSEAAKFVRDEFSPAERAQQIRSLPRDDPYVSLTDLWSLWQRNPASNWTAKQTIRWLVDYVDLPQYESVFLRYSITGKALPLLAMSNGSFLTEVLMIRNPIHKKKIMVKALDTILFGPPRRPSLLTTEASLVTASFSLMTVAVLGFSHWVYCTFYKNNLDDHENSYSTTENALKDFQSRLDDLERLQFALNDCDQDAPNTASLNTANKQRLSGTPEVRGLLRLVELKHQPSTHPNLFLSDENQTVPEEPIRDTDSSVLGCFDTGNEEKSSLWWSSYSESARNLSEWDAQRNSRTSVGGLDPVTDKNELALWLQLTYELEMQHYDTRKAEAETRLNSIRQACKRLHRKRYTILGSVRLIHSDGLDDLERRLVQAKIGLEQLQNEIRERHLRWTRIETLLGLKLRNNLGVPRTQQLLNSAIGNIHTFSAEQSVMDHGPEFNPEETRVPDGEQIQPNAQLMLKEIERLPSRTPSGKGQMPRNYSFVRPFAALWRKKVGSRLRTSSQASH